MYIDHINIRAPLEHLRQVKEFYIDILGLQEGYRPDFSSNGYWLYADDRPIVHLSESAEGAGSPQGALDHVAFRKTGLEDFLQTVKAAGIPYQLMQVPGMHLSQVFIKDPGGLKVEVNFEGELASH